MQCLFTAYIYTWGLNNRVLLYIWEYCLTVYVHVRVCVCDTHEFTQAEYVKSDIEDTRKSLKDTIVPAVRHCSCV